MTPQVIPERGYISITGLAEILEMSPNTLTERLQKKNVPILKLGIGRRQWLLNLADLRSGPDES